MLKNLKVNKRNNNVYNKRYLTDLVRLLGIWPHLHAGSEE